MNDGIKVTGVLQLQLLDGDIVVYEHWGENMIVTTGWQFIADAMFNVTRPDAMRYIEVGSDGTAESAADTALVVPVLRKLGVYIFFSDTKTARLRVTYEPGEATGLLAEAGVFDAASGGTMLNRKNFPVVNKAATQTLVATWHFFFS